MSSTESGVWGVASVRTSFRPRFKAIFFDLDDTLMDDETAYRRALISTCDDLARDHGIDAASVATKFLVVSEAFWTGLGTGGIPAARRSGSIDGEAIRLELWEDAFAACCLDNGLAAPAAKAYGRHRRETYCVFPDAHVLLEAVHRKLTLGVITNTTAEFALEKARLTGIDRYFDLFVASTDVGVGKPDPAIFEHALRKAGVSAADAIHVGDRLDTDVAGAHAAGLTSVWLNRRGATRRPEQPLPHFEIASLDELLSVVLAKPRTALQPGSPAKR